MSDPKAISRDETRRRLAKWGGELDVVCDILLRLIDDIDASPLATSPSVVRERQEIADVQARLLWVFLDVRAAEIKRELERDARPCQGGTGTQ